MVTTIFYTYIDLYLLFESNGKIIDTPRFSAYNLTSKHNTIFLSRYFFLIYCRTFIHMCKHYKIAFLSSNQTVCVVNSYF